MEPITIYIGNGLFNQSDLRFNEYVDSELRNRICREFDKIKDLSDIDLSDIVSIYLPQKNDEINDKSNYADSKMIYDGDNDVLDKTNILIALLDGQDLGLGTEIGRFAYQAERDENKTIIGLYSDTRQGDATQEKIDALDDVAESQFPYINLYTIGAIKSVGEVVRTVPELIDATWDAIARILDNKLNK